MKKLLSFFLAIVTVFATLSGATLSVHGKKGASLTASESEITDVMGLLEIMTGDGEGNLNLDAHVTRAQFVKMIIKASVYADATTEGASYSPYPDVRAGHWASAYIKSATSNGLINGYLDGTFRPDVGVKLEEAATVVLKLLGYTSEDMQGVYPAPQIALYKSLSLDARLSANTGDYLTRRDCMYLLYNMLSTENKDGEVYCKTLGYTTTPENVIDYINLVDVKTDGEFVFRTTLCDSRMTFDPYTSPNVRLYRDGLASNLTEVREYDYICFNNATRTVRAYSDKVFGVVDSVTIGGANPSKVKVNSVEYSISGTSASHKFSDYGELAENHAVMLVMDRKGGVFDAYKADKDMILAFADDETDLATTIENTLEGGKRVTDLSVWQSLVPFDTANSTFFLNDSTATAEDVKQDDIVYYSEAFDRVYLYRKTATGVLAGINPVAMPSSLAVNGVSYIIGNEDVSYKVSSHGKYFVDGDFVTVFLGAGDEVADIIAGDIRYISSEDDTEESKVLDSTVEGPYVYDGTDSWKEDLAYNVSEYEIVSYSDKDVEITPDSLEKNDIVYYSDPFRKIFVYRKKVTGVMGTVTEMSFSQTNSSHTYDYSQGVLDDSTDVSNNNLGTQSNRTGTTSTSSTTSYGSGSYASTVYVTMSGNLPAYVMVNSKNYALGDDKVIVDVYNNVYKEKDFVTLHLGKNDAVIAITKASPADLDETDNDIDYLGILEATIDGYVVADKNGTWKKSVPFDVSAAAVLEIGGTEDEIFGIDDIREGDVLYWSHTFNTLYVCRDATTGIVRDITYMGGMPVAVTVGTGTYSLGTNTSKLGFYNRQFRKDDFVTLLLGKDGKVAEVRHADAIDFIGDSDSDISYAELLNSTISKPIVIAEDTESWKKEIPFDVEGEDVTILRDNRRIYPDEIEKYSVVYYSASLKTLLVFDERITGTYESCLPTVISPTTVVVAGTTYSIETSDAMLAFSNLGTLRTGDTVTIIVGIKGGVAAVFAGEQTENKEQYGIISDISEKQFTRANGTTYTAETITVVLTNGKTVTYEHDDYGFDVGDFVRIMVKNGKATLTEASSETASDELSEINSLVKNGKFADNAVIYDVYGASVLKIYPSRLEGVRFVAKDILYCSLNSKGEIELLMLDDFTGDMHSYMYLEERTSRSAERSNATYYGYMNGFYTAVNAGNFVNVTAPGGVVVKYSGSEVTRIETIKVANVSKQNLSEDVCVIGGTAFDVWDKVQVYAYDTDSREYEQSTIEDVLDGGYTTFRAFYDNTPERGGKVRFVVVK